MANDRLIRELLPKQAEFVRAGVPGEKWHVMYSGAVGAGKSVALGFDAIAHVTGCPRARYGLFRKTNVALVRSTLKTMLEGDGENPPLLPPGYYAHNKTLQEINVKGGGQILYTGLDNEEKVRSMNLSGAGIEEVTECFEHDYATVSDRVRMNVGKPLTVKSATNPGSPSHHLAIRFGIATGHEARKNHRVIKTRSTDNVFLPPEVIEEYEGYTGAYYRRMVLGEWCQAEGVVYDVFDRERHVVHKPERDVPVYAGVDFGYVDPFVCLRVERHDGGHLHVRSEVHQRKLQPDEQVDRASDRVGDAREIICDSAEPGTIQMMRAKGLPAIPAEKGPNSIVAGIRLVSQRLANGTLTIEPDCTQTIAEFETYQWKENKLGLRDVPAEGADHAMDALRYLVQRLDAGSAPLISAVGSLPDDEPEPKTFEQMREDPEWGWR